MSFKSALALSAVFGAKAVLGHGLVSGTVTDGKYNPGFILDYYYAKVNTGSFPDVAGWYAENLDNGFVDGTGYASADIICHKNAANAATSATVSAGGTIEFQWTNWPESHFGPVFTYAAACGGDCTTVDKTTLEWFKIEEQGIDISTQTWGIDAMIANNNTWVTTVPSNLKADSYVFRHEIIAMHGAGSTNGAQNYPQCVNVEVTGSGTEQPAGVLGTALYTADHPGILFNPYGTLASYEIPGPAFPAVFGGSDSPAPTATAAPTTTAAPTVAPTATAAPTTTQAPATPTTAAPVPSATATSTPEVPSDGTTLPESFTLDTFITWLQSVAGGTSSKLRRHARDMM